MQPNGSGAGGKGGSNKQGIIIALLLLIMIVVIALGAYVIIGLLNREPDVVVQEVTVEPMQGPVGGSYVVDESNIETIMDDVEAEVVDGMFLVSMNIYWTFPDGKISTDAVLENSASNTKPVVAAVTIDETGEQIFESGVIPVGNRLKQIELQKEVAPGTYQATCTYYLLDEEGEINSELACALTVVIGS